MRSYTNESCIFFRNASHSGLNLVYYRKDGNIGWIDPRGIREKTIAKNKNLSIVDLEGVNSPKRGYFKTSFGAYLKKYFHINIVV